MARIVASNNLIFCAAGDLLYSFLGDGVENEHINTEDLSNKIPKIRKTLKENEAENEQDDSAKNVEYQILCMSASPCQKLLAIGTSHKTVLIFNTYSPFQCIRSFRIPKAPTTITFDKASEFIIVGDRAGHVRRYTVRENSDHGGRDDITGEICYYEGEPLMGAISMILDVAVSPNSKIFAVADRDEKIRIHRYPLAYVIEAFALGHSSYVSTIFFHGDRLFSAGGDSLVKEWNPNTGNEIMSFNFGNKPIKKIIVLEKEGRSLLVAFSESSDTVNVKLLNDNEEKCDSICCHSEILNICHYADNIYGLCRDGLVKFNVEHFSYEKYATPTGFCAKLMTVKEPISNYFKNVTHSNLEEYHQRKREKMLKEKEKKRKRKNSNTESAETKKIVGN